MNPKRGKDRCPLCRAAHRCRGALRGVMLVRCLQIDGNPIFNTISSVASTQRSYCARRYRCSGFVGISKMRAASAAGCLSKRFSAWVNAGIPPLKCFCGTAAGNPIVGSEAPSEVVIALGSNMNDRVGNLTGAVQSLRKRGVEIILCSSLYESSAAYIVDQPNFLNAAILATTTLPPLKLLGVLKATEQEFGRDVDGGIRFGPRPLDLDILAYGTEVLRTKSLAIPHERWHERDFVKAPVSDLAGFGFTRRNPALDDHKSATRFLKAVSSTWVREGGESRIGGEGLRRVDPLGGVSRANLSKQERKVRPSGSQTLVMGVLNVTPDSFSDGGKYFTVQSALTQARQLVSEGADIIDVGGQSTRPGATPLSTNEELERVVPIIKALAGDSATTGVLLSIDTFHARVAEAAVNEGASIVNDVSGGTIDSQMLHSVANLGVPYICMHMRGAPESMQSSDNTQYNDICQDVGRELQERAEAAMRAGVPAWNIILDPGIGFAKTHEGNLELIRGLRRLKQEALKGTCRQMPILMGASRKGFLGSITGKKNPEDRDVATAAISVACVQGGADIIRAHNAGFVKDAIRVADALYRMGH